MGMMRPWHWIVLILVILIIFGAAKLPQIAKSIGQSAKILKKEMKELQDDIPPEAQEAEGTPASIEAGSCTQNTPNTSSCTTNKDK